MELSPDEIEKFDRFSQNELTEEAEEAVSLRLVSDPTFKAKYLAYLDLQKGIRASTLQQKLSMLKSLENEISQGDLSHDSALKDKDQPMYHEIEHHRMETGIRYHHLKGKLHMLKAEERKLPSVLAKTRSTWLIAVLLLTGVVLSTVIWFSLPSHQTFDQFFEPEPSVFSVRGTQDHPRLEAYQAYENGKYGRAIRMFSTFSEFSTEERLLLANAYLAKYKFTEARNQLEKILSEEPNEDRAQWYLALALIGENVPEKATPLLQNLSQNSNYYQERALRLLEIL